MGDQYPTVPMVAGKVGVELAEGETALNLQWESYFLKKWERFWAASTVGTKAVQPQLVNRLIGYRVRGTAGLVWEVPRVHWISKLDFEMKRGKVCSALCSLVFIEHFGAQ